MSCRDEKTAAEIAEMLTRLREFAVRLGHRPSLRELEKEPGMPKYHMYRKYFGGLKEAMRLCGVSEIYPIALYSRDELIQRLVGLGDSLGRIPRTRDIGSSAELYCYRREFGSFAEALKAANIRQKYTSKPATFSDDELLSALSRVTRDHGYIPTYREYDCLKSEIDPAASTIRARFQTWKGAIARANLLGSYAKRPHKK